MSTPLDHLVAYLDEYLATSEVPDYPGAHNGLQVEKRGPVARVVVAVDACQASIDHAVTVAADLLVVHHGLFWDGDVAVTGRRFRRLHGLISNGVALYSSHLPLDCHGVVGNNALLAGAIGVGDAVPFGEFQGVAIGRAGTWAGSLTELGARVHEATGVTPRVIGTGPPAVSRIGVITGAGGSAIRDAAAAGLDTLVTGEGVHHSYFDAEESGLNVVYAGHYATETFGVRALGDHLAERFTLDVEFFDHPTGL